MGHRAEHFRIMLSQHSSASHLWAANHDSFFLTFSSARQPFSRLPWALAQSLPSASWPSTPQSEPTIAFCAASPAFFAESPGKQFYFESTTQWEAMNPKS